VQVGVVVPTQPSTIPDPAFATALLQLMNGDREQLRAAALRYAGRVDLYGMHARIVDELERRG